MPGYSKRSMSSAEDDEQGEKWPVVDELSLFAGHSILKGALENYGKFTVIWSSNIWSQKGRKEEWELLDPYHDRLISIIQQSETFVTDKDYTELAQSLAHLYADLKDWTEAGDPNANGRDAAIRFNTLLRAAFKSITHSEGTHLQNLIDTKPEWIHQDWQPRICTSPRRPKRQYVSLTSEGGMNSAHFLELAKIVSDTADSSCRQELAEGSRAAARVLEQIAELMRTSNPGYVTSNHGDVLMLLTNPAGVGGSTNITDREVVDVDGDNDGVEP